MASLRTIAIVWAVKVRDVATEVDDVVQRFQPNMERLVPIAAAKQGQLFLAKYADVAIIHKMFGIHHGSCTYPNRCLEAEGRE
jgi:thiamine monophosphate synthase